MMIQFASLFKPRRARERRDVSVGSEKRRARPTIECLEARAVPAAFSIVSETGSVSYGISSTYHGNESASKTVGVNDLQFGGIKNFIYITNGNGYGSIYTELAGSHYWITTQLSFESYGYGSPFPLDFNGSGVGSGEFKVALVANSAAETIGTPVQLMPTGGGSATATKGTSSVDFSRFLTPYDNANLMAPLEGQPVINARIGDTLTVRFRTAGVLSEVDGFSRALIQNLGFALLPPITIPSDIAINSLTRNENQGFDFAYSISNTPLRSAATINAYWANGITFADRIGEAIYSVPTRTGLGTYGAFSIDASSLGAPPIGATHLLLVADPPSASKPRGDVDESNEGNNIKAIEVMRPDLETESVSWNPKDGGVDFSYRVPKPLPSDTLVSFYWSDDATYEKNADALITSVPLFKGESGTKSSRLPASSFTVAPSAGTKFLLVVADPANQIDENDELNNVESVAYAPQIEFVGAKYDGDPSPTMIGRFFVNPPTGESPIKDQSLTVRLSDSLAALRPILTVGRYSAKPNSDSPGSWDGRTYMTEGFDPGTFDDMESLVSQARLGSAVLEEEESPRFRVLPLPDWFYALDDGTVEFNSGGGGRYTLRGYMARVGSSDTAAVPDDVPVVGGRKLALTLGYGIVVAAPLDTRSAATADAFVGIRANVLDLASLDYTLQTSVKLAEGFSIRLSLQSNLDPRTLEMAGGFGVTVGVSASATLGERTFVDDLKIVSVFLVEYGIKGEISYELEAQSQIVLGRGGFQLVGGGGSYLDWGPKVALTGFANVGWFVPLKFTDPLVRVLRRSFPNYFPASGNLLPALRLKNELEGSANLRSRIDFSGAANNPLGIVDTGVECSINVQVKATPEFLIGDVNLLGVVPPFTFQLFPAELPKKFKLIAYRL